MADLFDEIPEEISPELRKELMDLATGLRSAAAKIDVITQRKRSKDTDDNGEPTFRFNAKVSIPKEFFLTKRMAKYAIDRGFTEIRTKDMFDTFVRYYNKSLVKWADWTRVWMDWVRREEGRSGAQTPKTSDRLQKW